MLRAALKMQQYKRKPRSRKYCRNYLSVGDEEPPECITVTKLFLPSMNGTRQKPSM
jgi:hypothetical protein